MQPAFRIYANQTEITAAIRDRLIEMTVTDEAGIQSDELKLTLDDRRREDGAIAQLPRIGTVLTVSIGYAETHLVSLGRFIVDEVEMNAPPATLSVSAKAADMVGPFRSPKTRSWDATTLGKLVETIAAEHRYKPKVDPELGAIQIPHLDQTEESDMALLTRIAAKHDAIAKPVDGFLVLARQGAAKTITGQSLPTIQLAASDLAEWRYRHSARKPGGSGATKDGDTQKPPATASGGTKAYWWDFGLGERREVTTGKPPFEEIRYVHATEAEARAATATKKNAGERGQGELSFSLPGDPRLSAEGRLSISLRQGIPTDWRIKRVEHRLGAQGYTCQVECERFAAKQESVSNQPEASS
ncbi:MAG: contractile injection system protein, VgrG/Pvc8 family [Thiobacillus sp.]|nr:contractile injection system protein, VgrG/Pvc8 family [Thiobacillus sp.]